MNRRLMPDPAEARVRVYATQSTHKDAGIDVEKAIEMCRPTDAAITNGTSQP